MGENITQYKWKILAWNCIGRDQRKFTILEGEWFDKKEECVADFKETMRKGYDVADCWGSQGYLLKRRIMPKKYCL